MCYQSISGVSYDLNKYSWSYEKHFSHCSIPNITNTDIFFIHRWLISLYYYYSTYTTKLTNQINAFGVKYTDSQLNKLLINSCAITNKSRVLFEWIHSINTKHHKIVVSQPHTAFWFDEFWIWEKSPHTIKPCCLIGWNFNQTVRRAFETRSCVPIGRIWSVRTKHHNTIILYTTNLCLMIGYIFGYEYILLSFFSLFCVMPKSVLIGIQEFNNSWLITRFVAWVKGRVTLFVPLTA